MAADNHAILSCLVGIMDQLWFHQAVLFPLKILPPSSMATAAAASSEQPLLSSNSSAHSSDTQLISEHSSSIISNTYQDDVDVDDDEDYGDEKEERLPEGLQLLSVSDRKTSGCHHSYSPSSTRKRRPDVQFPGTRRRLSKTMSCKSLCELELEEVKGFMDLGFTFEKHHLNKRMMSVLPGLQRLDLKNHHQSEDEEEGEERGRGVIRPYLSEAWLVKRPDSPLLNLRVPRVSTADDMKKHLKYWAKTVASAIQLE